MWRDFLDIFFQVLVAESVVDAFSVEFLLVLVRGLPPGGVTGVDKNDARNYPVEDQGAHVRSVGLESLEIILDIAGDGERAFLTVHHSGGLGISLSDSIVDGV